MGGRHRPMHAALLMAESEDRQEAPPHPGHVARVQAGGIGIVNFRQRVERVRARNPLVVTQHHRRACRLAAFVCIARRIDNRRQKRSETTRVVCGVQTA